MYSISDLTTSIISYLSSQAPLVAVKDKIFYGAAPQGSDPSFRPFVRINGYSTGLQGVYGHKLFDSNQLLFTVFANSLSQASNLALTISDTLHAHTLTAGGETVRARRVNGVTAKSVGTSATDVCYSASVIFEFRNP